MKSVFIQIHNTTEHTLYLKSQASTHGIWRQPPPEIIEPNSIRSFGAENHGLTGTEGEVQYRVDANEECSIILPFFWKGESLTAFHLYSTNHPSFSSYHRRP